MDYKRKVVGEGFVVKERKYTKLRTKNVHREVIERSTYKVHVLECGHKAYIERPNAKTMYCHICSCPEITVFNELR